MSYRYMFTVPTEFGPAAHASDLSPEEIKRVHPKARITERLTINDQTGKVTEREPYKASMNEKKEKVVEVEGQEANEPKTTTTTTTPAPKKGK